MKDIHILLIGPVSNLKANFIGGATACFDLLISDLDNLNSSYTLINTRNFPIGLKRFLNPFHILIKVFSHVNKANVIFLNSSRGGTKYLAPILYVIAKIGHLKFVYRPFGGNMKDYTATYNHLQKWIFRQTILKSDILFLETKALLSYYKDTSANIHQLLNSRSNPFSSLLKEKKGFHKRFVFLGFVNQTKGIDLIIDVARQLEDDYTFHIYGPLMEDKYKELFAKPNTIYKGILKREQVLTTLSTYDVLVLPTYYKGEGYPGVIIEAYSLGLPVITTDWKAIPEIVVHGETGRLIPTQSTQALHEAIAYFNTNNYQQYTQQARKYFLASFLSLQVTQTALDKIKKLFK